MQAHVNNMLRIDRPGIVALNTFKAEFGQAVRGKIFQSTNVGQMDGTRCFPKSYQVSKGFREM